MDIALRSGFGTITLDGSIGFGTDEGQIVGRTGVTFGWCIERLSPAVSGRAEHGRGKDVYGDRVGMRWTGMSAVGT